MEYSVSSLLSPDIQELRNTIVSMVILLIHKHWLNDCNAEQYNNIIYTIPVNISQGEYSVR